MREITERRDVVVIEDGKEIYVETFPVIYNPINQDNEPCIAPLDIREVIKLEPKQRSR